MKIFFTLSKRNLALILCSLVVAAVCAGWYTSVKTDYIDGSTNALRVDYLNGLGLEVDDSGAVSKNIIIPSVFSDVYCKYNELQKTAGFDLIHYKGENAVVYTYPERDSERTVHLIVKDGKIIGGDITSANIYGEMLPLKRS